MNIIILEDLKGFRKTIEVPKFPPTYQIAELPPLTVKMFNHEKTYEDPLSKIITFYPKGEPKEVHGSYVLLYKQMDNTPPLEE